jgi:hypothetical protein
MSNFPDASFGWGRGHARCVPIGLHPLWGREGRPLAPTHRMPRPLVTRSHLPGRVSVVAGRAAGSEVAPDQAKIGAFGDRNTVIDHVGFGYAAVLDAPLAQRVGRQFREAKFAPLVVVAAFGRGAAIGGPTNTITCRACGMRLVYWWSYRH